MKQKQATSMDDNALIEKYVDAASEYGIALEAGRSREANKQAEVLTVIHDELRARGQTSLSALVDLLNHPNDGVRLWAGCHVMEFDPEKGEKALEALAPKQKSFVALSAHFLLEERRRKQ